MNSLRYLYLHPDSLTDQRIEIFAQEKEGDFIPARLNDLRHNMYTQKRLLSLGVHPDKQLCPYPGRLVVEEGICTWNEHKSDYEIIQSEKKEKLIRYLKSTHPEQLLLDMSSGRKPIKSELETINELLNMGLSIGVVNVLIQYIILEDSRGQFNTFKAKKFGRDWVRLNITTVEQAMEFGRKNNKRIY